MAVFALSACEEEPDLEDREVGQAETQDTMQLGADRDVATQPESDVDYGREGELGTREQPTTPEEMRQPETQPGTPEDIARPAEPYAGEATLGSALNESQLEQLDSLIQQTLQDLQRAQQLIREARSASDLSTQPSEPVRERRDTADQSSGALDSSSPWSAVQDTTKKQTEANEVEVVLREYEIEMEDSISAGETTFSIRNAGTIEHSFEIEGNGIEKKLSSNLAPGAEQTLTVNLEPGTYEVYCPVEDHDERGMSLQLTVTSDKPALNRRR
jgi:plastocyanin